MEKKYIDNVYKGMTEYVESKVLTHQDKIYKALKILRHRNINVLQSTIKYILRWELWKEVEGSNEVLIYYSSYEVESWRENIKDLSTNNFQASIMFPPLESLKLKSNVENFTLRLYSVKYSISNPDVNGYLSSALSTNNAADYIDNQNKKNNIAYLGGFRIIFTYQSDLQTYSIQMVTINAENIQEKTINISNYFNYHTTLDKNNKTPNTTIFSTDDISNSDLLGQIRRSNLIYNLGAISYSSERLDSNIVFKMGNIQDRITEESNEITFSDVYGSDSSRFQVDNWITELTLIDNDFTDNNGDTDYLYNTDGQLSSTIKNLSIGKSIDVDGYHWKWSGLTGYVINDDNSGLTILSPNIDLSGASFSSWSGSDQLNLFARTNFIMLFNHKFRLSYTNQSRSFLPNHRKSNYIRVMHSTSMQSEGVRYQKSINLLKYANTTLLDNIELGITSTILHTYYNFFVIFIAIVVLVMLHVVK